MKTKIGKRKKAEQENTNRNDWAGGKNGSAKRGKKSQWRKKTRKKVAMDENR